MSGFDYDSLLDELLQEGCSTDEGCSKEEGCKKEGCKKEEGCGNEEGISDDETYTDDNLISELQMEESDDDEDFDDDIDDDDDEDDDFDDVLDDIGDLTDDDLDKVANDLSDGDDEDEEDDDEQVRLDPEEEIEADNLMQVAGTASLIRSEMNMEERAAFLESTREVNTAMVEGFINDSVVEEMRQMTETFDSDDIFQEAKIYSKNTIRLNKEARLAQLFSIAVYSSARAHNDPEYKKWKKARKAARFYSKNMRRKYKSEATKRMRVLFARLRNSKSPIIKNLGKKVDGK